MTICFTRILVLVNLILHLSSQENVERSNAAGCKVEQHFHSSVMTPLIEEVAEVTGCSSKVMSSESQEIYVLSLLNSGFNEPHEARTGYLPSVSLLVRPHWKQRALAAKTVIILHSVTPVMWQVNLQHVENSTNFYVIVNKPSYIVPSVSVSVSRQKIPLRKKLTSWVSSHYGAITSYSSVSIANKITLFIGSDIYASDNCNVTSASQSDNVEATYIQPQPASGCNVNNNHTEKRLWLLYIIELNFTGLSQDVRIHLQSHIESERIQKLMVEQNILLVLKCHTPGIWIIESKGLQGSLHIVAEYPVHIRTNPKYITAVVQEKGLPSDTAALLNEVQSSFGPIDSYMRTTNANRINMAIKGKVLKLNSKESKSDGKSPVSATTDHKPISESELLPTEKETKLKIHEGLSKVFWKHPLSLLLMEQMFVECLEDHMKIVFPFDKTMDILTTAVGINNKLSSVSLIEANCKAEINESHIVLESSWNDCGTQSFYDEHGLIYHNQVQFVTSKFVRGSDSQKKHFFSDDDDSSEDGSGSQEVSFPKASDATEHIIYPIPFHCTKKPSSNASTSTKRFEMNIFLKKDFQDPVPKESFPLKVIANYHLFAEATINADPRLCIIADECWIAKSEGFGLKANKKIILIKQGCSTDLSVQMLSDSSCTKSSLNTVSHTLKFSFQLSEDFTNQNVHLNCYFSACARKDSSQLGEKQCIDTENLCLEQSLRPYLKMQRGKKNFVTCGPFHVTSKLQVDNVKELLFFSNPVESSSPENFVDYSFDKLTGLNKKNPMSPQLIFIGLSTEAVVGIAFASFIIGAGLMAALWLIHMHTEPSRHSKEHKNDASKQGHLSYHCSRQRYEETETIENLVPHSVKPISLRICS